MQNFRTDWEIRAKTLKSRLSTGEERRHREERCTTRKTLNTKLCVPTKQLKEKEEERKSWENIRLNHQAALTSNLLLPQLLHRVHLQSSAFVCPSSNFISHQNKLGHKKKLFKV